MDNSHIIRGRKTSSKDEEAHRQRQHMTCAETLLWESLRADRLGGLHFRRQQVIDRLIVECDGSVHAMQREHDEDRDAILTRRGLLVLRFTNEQIETETERVLCSILGAARERIARFNRQEE